LRNPLRMANNVEVLLTIEKAAALEFAMLSTR
jgi:hypothetical protein